MKLTITQHNHKENLGKEISLICCKYSDLIPLESLMCSVRSVYDNLNDCKRALRTERIMTKAKENSDNLERDTTKICKVCGKTFYKRHKKAFLCSERCKAANFKKNQESRRLGILIN